MGHGTHWEAVLKNFDGDFPAALDLGIQKGEVIGKSSRDNWSGPLGVGPAVVTLIQNAGSGVGVLSVVIFCRIEKRSCTLPSPVAAAGLIHRVHIVEVHESSFGLEACITASIGEAKIKLLRSLLCTLFGSLPPGYRNCHFARRDRLPDGGLGGRPNSQSPGNWRDSSRRCGRPATHKRPTARTIACKRVWTRLHPVAAERTGDWTTIISVPL